MKKAYRDLLKFYEDHAAIRGRWPDRRRLLLHPLPLCRGSLFPQIVPSGENKIRLNKVEELGFLLVGKFASLMAVLGQKGPGVGGKHQPRHGLERDLLQWIRRSGHKFLLFGIRLHPRKSKGYHPKPPLAALLLCLILSTPSLVFAADPPETFRPVNHLAAPTPAPVHKFWDKQNKFLVLTGAGLRTADIYTTREIFQRKGEDGFLPRSAVSSTPRMAAFSAIGAAGTTGLMYLAHRKGHHRVERALGWAQVIFVGNCVFGNIEWLQRYGSWPKVY